jgi:multiple sugar transport system substrate-binding protein
MKYKGKIFNMPYNGGTYALFYNKDIFDKTKARYPDDNWTWDQYIQVGTQLTTDTKGTHGNEAGFDGNNIAIYGASSLQGEWQYWLGASGAELYTTNNKEVNFRDPKVLDAIQWLADTNKRRIWPSSLVRDPNPMGFRNGNMALWPNGHWNVARVRTDPFKWDVVAMPKSKDGKRVALGWYSGAGLVRLSKSPDAGWEFLKWFGGAPGQRLLGLEGLTLPAVRKVAESDEIMKSTPPDNQRAFLADIDKARIRYNWNITEQRLWDEILNPELNKIWSGEAKAKDVLPPLVPRLNEVLAQN